MIYFIQPISGGPVKIGTTVNVAKRQKTLERLYGVRFRILFLTAGGVSQERIFHQTFSKYRLGKTEQFRPGKELVEFIEQPGLEVADDVPMEPLVETMEGRQSISHLPSKDAMGPTLAYNLIRLGLADIRVDVQALRELVQSNTGQHLTTQAVTAAFNSIRVSNNLLAIIAKALGVKVSDLLKTDD